MNVRVVDAAVVEDEAGAGKGHPCFLGLQLELDNVMVTWRKEQAHQDVSVLLAQFSPAGHATNLNLELSHSPLAGPSSGDAL